MHFVELSLDLTYRIEYKIEYLIVKLKVEFLIAMHLKSLNEMYVIELRLN